ncbi:isocitrate lyase/phosphoenolpyruvate mutase family protein [Serratia marcescens]|nr:isocitrate lyase/phosphoenolpyruvate mutase family protein [Serratia marcescens]
MNIHDNAKTFAQLHRQSQPLRLPNAWDAGSALLIESLVPGRWGIAMGINCLWNNISLASRRWRESSRFHSVSILKAAIPMEATAWKVW